MKIETIKDGKILLIENLERPLILKTKTGDFVTVQMKTDRILVEHDTKVAEFQNGTVEVLDLINGGE